MIQTYPRRLIVPDFEIDDASYPEADLDIARKIQEANYGRLKVIRNEGSLRTVFPFDVHGLTDVDFTLAGDDITELPFKGGVLNRQGDASLDFKRANLLIVPQGASVVARVALSNLVDPSERLTPMPIGTRDPLVHLMETVHERKLGGIVYDICAVYGFDPTLKMDVVRVAVGGMQHALNFRNIRLPAAPVVAEPLFQEVSEYAYETSKNIYEQRK